MLKSTDFDLGFATENRGYKIYSHAEMDLKLQNCKIRLQIF